LFFEDIKNNLCHALVVESTVVICFQFVL